MPPNPNIPNNSEIDQALKEFEAKSNNDLIIGQTEIYPKVQAVITPQTSKTETNEISFDTNIDSHKVAEIYNETKTPKIVKIVIRFSGGVIKNQRQAELVLFGMVILMIGVSVYLSFGAESASKKITPAMIQEMINEHN